MNLESYCGLPKPSSEYRLSIHLQKRPSTRESSTHLAWRLGSTAADQTRNQWMLNENTSSSAWAGISAVVRWPGQASRFLGFALFHTFPNSPVFRVDCSKERVVALASKIEIAVEANYSESGLRHADNRWVNIVIVPC